MQFSKTVFIEIELKFFHLHKSMKEFVDIGEIGDTSAPFLVKNYEFTIHRKTVPKSQYRLVFSKKLIRCNICNSNNYGKILPKILRVFYAFSKYLNLISYIHLHHYLNSAEGFATAFFTPVGW